jgi:hypothetical protein
VDNRIPCDYALGWLGYCRSLFNVPSYSLPTSPSLIAMNYNIFRDELGSKYPAYGHALWEPDPGGLYDYVEVGDVGFIRKGRFHRLFNALLPEGHPKQSSRVPEYHTPLEPNMDTHIVTSILDPNDFCSREVTVESDEFGFLAFE